MVFVRRPKKMNVQRYAPTVLYAMSLLPLTPDIGQREED